MTTGTRAGADGERVASVMTLGWTLKRALIGVALLFAFVIGTTLLFDAAIEPEPASSTAAAITPDIVR